MLSTENMAYNAVSEKLVEILCRKTGNNNPLFFRVLVAYYFGKVASMMRTNISTHDRGDLPVNIYAINLASSGQGKGHSTNIIEEQVIDQFRDRFLSETFPLVSEINLAKLAVSRAARKQSCPDEERTRVDREFYSLGELAFSFDSGTPAAIKQMRHMLLMSGAGSMNMEIDEIGSHLTTNTDALNAYLEMYDVGKIKQKLTKNTAENTRSEEIEGRTPANMMLYGTPSKLFNGGKTEEDLLSFLETGFGRRCLFGYNVNAVKVRTLTAKQIYLQRIDKTAETFLNTISDQLGQLADAVNFGRKLTMTEAVHILLIEYQLDCEDRADLLPEHEDIRKSELTHRYFKALKLAGAYAFIEGDHEVKESHIYSAIKLVEGSGDSLNAILTRDRNYQKLAKYIANVGREVTHVDLVEDLPFYKGTESAKRELMTLAVAYGYQNNIVIKKIFSDGIEFLKGESLAETDIDKMTVSYGVELAYNYENEVVPFDQLHNLTQQAGYHWTNHHLVGGHRKEDNAIGGFNLVVIDVDEGVSLSTAKLLLKEYKSLIYTTKRHTEAVNRFRIILPISHTLKMDSIEFREFMTNIYEWLPFKVDEQTNQRARKWMSHNGDHWYNDGKVLDALDFIPKTTKNEERRAVIDNQQSLSNMERWFINNTGTGNRSNQYIKFALLLVDSGMDIASVRANVMSLNTKMPDKMDEGEIDSTIMQSASKAAYKRDALAGA